MLQVVCNTPRGVVDLIQYLPSDLFGVGVFVDKSPVWSSFPFEVVNGAVVCQNHQGYRRETFQESTQSCENRANIVEEAGETG